MKKLILLLFLLPTIAFGQTTLIPDSVFEQALISFGYDIMPIDGSVPTANISGINELSLGLYGISDLTGIEDFTALTILDCGETQLTSLDVSNNTALTWLRCGGVFGLSNLTSLDVSNNTALTHLGCALSNLTSLDVSNNTALITLYCGYNQLTSLDVSQNTALTKLQCDYNQLTCLNVKNGNNANMFHLWTDDNPNLTCIEVDDAAYSNTNWVSGPFYDIDDQTSFSEDCGYPSNCFAVGIEELPTKPKDLLTITDILGRTTYPVPNQILFYIYDDGSVEKKIRLER